MEQQQFETALAELQKNSPKRNFKQSVDLIVNFRNLNLKNPEDQVNLFVTLQHDFGKKVSVCALVGPELEAKAKTTCDEVILVDDFERFKGKKEIKRLAEKHDYFIAQANLMGKIATVFGRVLGPRGKMPNPKVGAVVPPNANLEPLVARLKKTIHLVTKNDQTVRCMVGKDDTTPAILTDNIMSIYKSILQRLPNEAHNIKSVMLKYTMSSPVFVGQKAVAEEDSKKKGKKPAAKKTEQKPAEQVQEAAESKPVKAPKKAGKKQSEQSE